jgi:outer membrane protein
MQSSLRVSSLVSLLLPAILSAQSAQRITLTDAIQIALRQNLQLKQAENNLELQQATASVAKKGLLPSFSFGTSASEVVGQSFNQAIGKVTTQTTRYLSPGVSTGLLLFDGTRTYANISSANHNATASSADLDRARQTAAFNAATNFIAYLGARSQRMVQEANVTAVDAQLKQIETMVNVGEKPRTDLYAQRAQAASARLTQAQAFQAEENARLDLIQSLQLDPDGLYEFVPPEMPDSLAPLAVPVDSLVRIAREHRSDVLAARERLVAAGQDVRAAKVSRLPSLNLNAGYNTNYTSATDSPVLTQFNDRRGGSATINFSLPIFDRGNISFNAQRAEVNQENAELAVANQQRVASLEVRRAAMTVRSAYEQLAAATAQESSARLALEGSQERYRAGAAQLLEVTQSQSQLVAAQTALSNARFNVTLMRTALMYYAGTLDMNNPVALAK